MLAAVDTAAPFESSVVLRDIPHARSWVVPARQRIWLPNTRAELSALVSGATASLALRRDRDTPRPDVP
jgi:hypothetical protein